MTLLLVTFPNMIRNAGDGGKPHIAFAVVKKRDTDHKFMEAVELVKFLYSFVAD